MIVRPRRRREQADGWPEDADEVRTLASGLTDGLFIECVTVAPPSAEGRKVTLWIRPEDADAMLRELRDYGVARRRPR